MQIPSLDNAANKLRLNFDVESGNARISARLASPFGYVNNIITLPVSE